MGSEAKYDLKLGLVGGAQVVQGIESIINLLGQAINKMKEWAAEAATYQAAVQGHAVSVREANEATAGLIDSITLHQEAARLEQAGIRLTSEQYRGLAAAAGEVTTATGEDMTEAFQRLTRAVVSGSTEALRPFNVHMQESGTIAERQQRAIDALTERFGDFQKEIGNTGEAMDQLSASWDTMFREMLLTAESSSGPLMSILQGINNVVTDITNALQTQRTAMENLRRSSGRHRVMQAEQTLRELGIAPSSVEISGSTATGELTGLTAGNVISQLTHLAGAALTGGETDLNVQRQTALREYALASRAELAAGGAGGTGVPEQRQPTARPDQPTAPRRRGGGGGRRRQQFGGPERALAQSIEDQMDAAAEAEERWEEIEDRFVNAQEELDMRLTEAADELKQADIDRAEKTAEAWEDAYQRKVEAADAAAEAQREAEQRTQDSLEKTRDTIDTVNGALTGMANIFSMVIDAKKNEVDADKETLDRLAKIEGGFLVALNVAKGIHATAEMATAIASEDWKGAVLWGIAAAEHYAAAAIAGARLGSDRGDATTGKTTPSSAVGGGSGGGDPTDKTMIVNINGPVTSRRVNEELGNMERDADRRGG